MNIIYKTKQEIETIRQGGIILSNILDKTLKQVKPGITTEYLENMATSLIEQAGGRPSFKGYRESLNERPFPTTLCASIDNEVVHAPAIPARTLRQGQIITLDIGMEWPYKKGASGLYTDMAKTVGVGEISKEAEKLIKATKKCLDLAIEQVKPGNHLSDIGRAIQTYAQANGYGVVRDLGGHGVGKKVHEDPIILNYVPNGNFNNVELRSGMVIAIEPMITAGDWRVVEDINDGWTIKTADNSLAAHFEHTIAVTKNGHKVLTI